MTATVTSMGGNNQIWNLGNNMINTADLVNLEMQALETRKSPMTTRKQNITNEKSIYEGFKKDFSKLVQTFKDMSSFKGTDKPTTLSQTGFVSAAASADAISGTFSLTVDKLAERHQISGTKNVADLDADLGVSDQFTLTVGTKSYSIPVTPDMSVRDLINNVNNGNYGVSMYTVGSRVFMAASESGTANTISLTDGASNTLRDTLGLLAADGTVNTMTAAQDAAYTVNGVPLTSSSNTVENAISGVTLNLQQTTTSPVRLDVSNSTDAAATKMVQDMVSTFNDAVGILSNYAGEGSYMQASTAALSTGRAMSQIASFELNGQRLSTFGIQTDKTGNLTVDSAKLAAAFKQNPDAAKQFFFGASGLSSYMNKQMDPVFGDTGMVSGRVQSLDGELKKVNDQIDKIDASNKDKQAAIIDKYSKYEQQMSALNVQLSYLKAITNQKSSDE
ncbi:flagellar hook-associated protein 2 [Ectobacillus ponti]|uniref:Flagellar hook-associated protein 2 n=1 Tax=Ectobacillus ponti TaxID=2961894 RepID=A0AA41X7Z5_9BACI|nr:flagellar hook-associated protein 2 [Ectobacillus ponti]MCP8968838.1 flagellar hook-associated protein 2 [Ectobacillus ponti]